ncbi:DNA cytosine methyltransferase [Streptomyces griseorubiginosus]|uniref:DNA cytosine methyltransferase n=1 Tax=Streptomyces griseorubiginosus TaxID=67304 RepID=UPI00331F6DD0
MTAIHLFAGPGGLEHGAGLPGVGIELDANAVATRVAAGLATKHGDVTKYGPRDFPNATVMTAGPPCQTFKWGQWITE